MARTHTVLEYFNEYRLQPDPFLNRPSLIIPTYYRTNNDITYEFYKTGPNGENYLLKHYQQAKIRAQAQGRPLSDIFGLGLDLLIQTALEPGNDVPIALFKRSKDLRISSPFKGYVSRRTDS